MHKAIKPIVFTTALLPLAHIVWLVISNNLGPDPIQQLSIETGERAFWFLIIALAMTPLRQLTGRVEFIRVRRMVGLFALFYASIHFLAWMSLMLEFRWLAVAEEILERPYITIGFAAYLILLILGITSPMAMVRKLGRKWKPLHRLVYAAALLALIHQLWIQRSDLRDVALFGSLIALLLGYRLLRRIRARNQFGR
ncbi:MAG: sulfite oxidase heme-binding subunit YedZ [Pseudohongiellaceae bacterium]